MWSVILIFAALAAADDVGPLRFQVTPTTIQPGEHASLEIRLQLVPEEKGVESDLPVVQDDLLSNQPRMQIIERDFKKTDDEWIWRYDVTSYELGELTIPPVEIRRRGENYSTESVKVEVATRRDSKDLSLRPEFGALSRPFPWRGFFLMLLGLGILAGVYYWVQKNLDRWLKKIRVPVRPAAPAAPTESPEAWLRRELQAIKERLEQTDSRIIDDLSAAWRGYFARRANHPVEAWTSFEMLARLSQDAKAQAISPLWIECDHYKFAGQVMDPSKLANRSIEESERVLLNVATG